MLENLLLLGKSALVLLCAYGASFAAVTLLRRRRQTPTPPANARIRLRADSGMYRTRLLEVQDGEWHLAAPLQRDRYVPLRAGEVVTVEATMPDGVMLFRTEVLGRDPESATVSLRPPAGLRVTDRRTAPRMDAPAAGNLDGQPVEVLSLSSCGARLMSETSPRKGESVQFESDLLEESVEAFVLEANVIGARTELRLRFAFPVTLR